MALWRAPLGDAPPQMIPFSPGGAGPVLGGVACLLQLSVALIEPIIGQRCIIHSDGSAN